MSTGDVRRPSANKLSTKATATGGPKDDESDSDTAATTESSATTSTTASKSSTATRPDVRPGAKTAAKAATRTNRPVAKAPAGRPAGKGGGGKGRKPVKAVRVAQGRNWGPIAMFAGAGLVAVLIIGFGGVALFRKAHQPSWQDRAAAIEGIHDYLKTNPDYFKYDTTQGNHKPGVLQYPTSPPVGGVHNPYWQNCMGDVYTAEIPKEQATHSMEHGAVWIAYNPDLPKDQVAELASKVNGKSYMLMSPYPGLDKPISLQAWGYQLKLDSAGDDRIDQFVDALRQNATQEPQAGCQNGITDTGSQPLNLTPPDTSGTGGGTGTGG